ncbi:MAG: Kelch repeat-containing protein, partial [Candidatus Sericytochromatia bacterium]
GNGGLLIAPVKPGTWQLFGRAGTLRVGPIPLDLSRDATGSLDFAPDASVTAALPAPRAGAASGTLQLAGSSRMVVAGGLVGPLDSPRATDSVLAFDGSVWETLPATMSQAVSHGAFAAHSGELWVLGGIRPDGSVTAAIQRLDATTGTWTQLPQALVSPSYLASARFLSNSLYVTAGLERRADGSFHVNPWIYRMDLLTGLWTILGDQLGEPKLTTARYGSACATVDGKLFVLSGVTATGDLTRSVEIVDPSSGTSGAVRSAAPIPTPRFGAVAWVASGKIHVAGGVTAQGKALDAVEVYDVASDRWEVRPPLKIGRGFAARGVLGDRAFVAGGHDGTFSPGFDVSPLDATEALRLEAP